MSSDKKPSTKSADKGTQLNPRFTCEWKEPKNPLNKFSGTDAYFYDDPKYDNIQVVGYTYSYSRFVIMDIPRRLVNGSYPVLNRTDFTNGEDGVFVALITMGVGIDNFSGHITFSRNGRLKMEFSAKNPSGYEITRCTFDLAI